MELHDTSVTTADGVVRHHTRVRFIGDKLPASSVTFEVAEQWLDWVDPSPGALIPAALILAARLGDDLTVDAPIDDDMRAACLAAIGLQSRWWGWRPPELHLPSGRPPRHAPEAGAGCGLFFTRGGDSWGSLLTGLEAPADRRPTHLITVDGDVHLPEEVRSAVLLGTEQAAAEAGLPWIGVRTDLRSLIDPHSDWGRHTHGAALAGVGYLLRRGLGEIRIAATNWWPDATPWGSHPSLDPLWSTPGLRVVHDGTEEHRWRRVARVSRHRPAIESLDVCWESQRATNCGRCKKCLLVMTTLFLSGEPGWEGTFDVPFDAANISALSAENPNPLINILDHCDAIGLRADPLRQRWESVASTPFHGFVYRWPPVQPRVPVRTVDGGPLGDDLTLGVGQLLARLGVRVDHLADTGPEARSALVVGLAGGGLVVAEPGGIQAVAGPEDLVAPLARIGVTADRRLAFDPDGFEARTETWAARRRLDATGNTIPTVAGTGRQ